MVNFGTFSTYIDKYTLGPVVSDQDISGHRHILVGFHMPSKRGHGHGHGHGHEKEGGELKNR